MLTDVYGTNIEENVRVVKLVDQLHCTAAGNVSFRTLARGRR